MLFMIAWYRLLNRQRSKRIIMADITKIDTTVNELMLKDQIAQLPELNFRSNIVDIASAVDILANGVSMEFNEDDLTNEPVEGEAAEEMVKKTLAAYQKLKSNDDYESCFVTLNKLANKLGANLITTFNALQYKVKPTVDELKASLDGKIETIIETKKLQHKVRPLAEPNTNFKVMQWDTYLNKFGGTEELSSMFKDMCHIPPTYFMSDIDYALSMDGKFIGESLELDADAKADIERRLTASLPQNKDEVREVMNLAFDAFEYNSLVFHAFKDPLAHNEFSKLTQMCTTVIDRYQNVLNVFRKTPLDVTTPVLESIHARLDAVDQVLKLAGYTLLVLRNQYRDNLVMSDEEVNGDEVANFEKDGGTMLDVAKHIAVTQEIPASGVATAKILEMKTQIAERYAEMSHQYITDAGMIKEQVTKDAARQVLKSYLEGVSPDDLPEDTPIDEFIEANENKIDEAVDNLNVNGDFHVENMLYDFVMQLWYRNSSVQKAHQLFGRETVKMFNLSKELSSKDLQTIDSTVANSLAANFIASKILEVK